MSTSKSPRTVLWFETANPKPDTQALTGDMSVRTAIVGAGFTGLTASLHLAERGRSVAVFEAGTIAAGASGVNAGFVVPNFAKADPARVAMMLGEDRGVRLLKLVAQGADRVFDTARRHAIDCDAEQTGWMHVAHDAPSSAMLSARAAAWQRLERPVRMLSGQEARDRVHLRHCEGALIDESGGTIHPVNYAYGIARAAMRAGASIHEHARVDDVRRTNGGWQLHVDGRTVTANSVLLCTNASSEGIARLLHRTIVPLKVYQAATAPLPREEADRISPRRNPIADTRSNLFTLRLDRQNRLISGGMAMLPIGARQRMGKMIARRLGEELGFPAPPSLEHVWSGTAAMTPDFIPHLYEFGPGFFGGIGCNGRGVAMTAMLGEVLADAADGIEDLPIPFASTRGIPMHLLARAAPSFAIAQARFSDWRAGI